MYSTWLWQLTKPGMMMDRPEVDDARRRGSRRRAAAPGPTATMRSPATASAPSAQHRRRHREDPVGAVDRDVAVGVGHLVVAQRDAEARAAPHVRWSIGEPRAQWQTAAAPRHADAARRPAVYSPRTSDGRAAACSSDQGPSYLADVVTSAVWDAVKDLPGVRDLYRNPLQSLGERVHLERHGPVRLDEDDEGQLLEIHLVAEPGADLAAVGEAVARAGATYLARTTGKPITRVEVHVDDIADRLPT